MITHYNNILFTSSQIIPIYESHEFYSLDWLMKQVFKKLVEVVYSTVITGEEKISVTH